jgi:hypothetical protein
MQQLVISEGSDWHARLYPYVTTELRRDKNLSTKEQKLQF